MKQATDTLRWLVYGCEDGLGDSLKMNWVFTYLDLLL